MSYLVATYTGIVRKIYTDFSVAARYTTALTGGGSTTINTTDTRMTTSATATSSVNITYRILGHTNGNEFDGSPVWSSGGNLGTIGTDVQFFLGIGNLTVTGSAITFTGKHVGFKIIRAASGAINLSATQADGTTENASAVLTTVAGTDELDLIVKVNGSTSADYYWRKNGGALSAATNLTANLPTGTSAATLQAAISNVDVATASTFFGMWMSYER